METLGQLLKIASPARGLRTATITLAITLLPMAVIACGIIDFMTTKTCPATVKLGENITCTVTVKQQNSGVSTGGSMTDTFPAGWTFVSASGLSCNPTATNVTCSLPNMFNGQSATVQLTFKVPSDAACGKTVINTATASAREADSNGSNNTATASINILCNVDLSIVKTGPATVGKGGTILYQVTVKNNSTDTATNVTVTDAIPAGVTFNAAQSDSSCVQTGTNIVCSGFNLAGGASKTLTIAFNTSLTTTACGTVISNTATVGPIGGDPNPANNTSNTVQTTVRCSQSDISVRKEGPGIIAKNQVLVYKLIATNHGPDTVDNITVTDPIPDSTLTFNASQSDPRCSLQGTNIVCKEVNSVLPGQSISFNVAFNVTQSARCETIITNSATVDAPGNTDPNPGNNSSNTVQTRVNCEPDLTVEKKGPAGVNAGEIFSYKLIARNSGQGTAQNVTITDMVPAGLTFIPGECTQQGNMVVCGPFDLGPGASREFTLTFQAPASSMCEMLFINQAEILLSGKNVNWSNIVQTRILCPADLALEKKGPASVQQGTTEIEYTLTITNLGASKAENVHIADVIPAGLTFNTAKTNQRNSASGISCAQVGNNVECGYFSIKPGQTRDIFLVFNLAQSVACDTVIINSSIVISDTPDPNPANNKSNVVQTTVVCPDTKADLSIQKSGDALVTRGNTVKYTVTVTNNGPNRANNVRVTDEVPAGLTYNQAASSTQCFLQGTTVQCNQATLNAFEKVSFTIAFDISQTAKCNSTISNTAKVISDTFDPALGNNTSNNLISVIQCPIGRADLTITKSADKSAVKRGDKFIYTVTVQNTGPDTATNVRITDIIPSGLEFDPTRSSPECTKLGNTVTCAIGDLAGGFTKQVTIAVIVAADATCNSTVSNTASVTSNTEDPTPSNNTSTAVRVLVQCDGTVPNANLVIEKTDGKITAKPGEQLTYLITVRNIGTAAATDVRIIDVLPSGVTFQSANSNGNLEGQSVVWTIAQIAPQSSVSLTVSVRIRTDVSNGTVLRNIASVEGKSATDFTTVEDGGGSSSSSSSAVAGRISLRIDDDPDPIVLPCENIVTYTIELENSTQSAVHLEVRADLDSDMEFVDASDGGDEDGDDVVWDDILVDADDTEDLTLDVRIADGTDPGEVRLKVTAKKVNIAGTVADGTEKTRVEVLSQHCSQSQTSIYGSTIVAGPLPHGGIGGGGLLIDLRADQPEVLPGSSVGFMLTLTNQSPNLMQGILTDVTISGGPTFVENPGGGIPRGSGLGWQIPALRPGESRIFHYRINIGGGRIITSVAQATAPGLQGPATDREDVFVIPGLPQTGTFSLGENAFNLTSIDAGTTGSNSAVGATLWTILALLGVSGGSVLGKRWFLN